LGYNYPHLEYHVATGTFERVEHGLYRLADIPVAENEDLIRLSLWSRNRADEPQAVVSHESALVLHGLTELLPDEIHLTVRPGFRKDPPRGCVLHKGTLVPADVEERVGFRVTTPLRTLVDVAVGTTSQEQLEKAVVEALDRGLVRRNQLVEAIRRGPGMDRLERTLGEHR
jgi:predicted transcriptional regulator of viral defense system